ncbi:hypothetical protein NMG60_11015735 [Bertholletia excelsa]
MEIQATPFPGKSQPSIRKTVQPTKNKAKEPPVNRQRRVFGTNRNPNIPAKTVSEKPVARKPSANVSPNQTNPTKTIGKNSGGNVQEGDTVEGSRTPPVVGATPASAARQRVSGTPYQTAERCSKCRFDRLETSSYWLGQIKLAESVGKHFASAAFFRLALESKAEPIRNLRSELKRYVARHDGLSSEAEWREASVSYGLIQADANGGSSDQTRKDPAEEHPVEEQFTISPKTESSTVI